MRRLWLVLGRDVRHNAVPVGVIEEERPQIRRGVPVRADRVGELDEVHAAAPCPGIGACGCTVGNGCLIGMGATVLNRARIGRFCIVGANALVTEGKEFPDFSLIVGSPAKVVRELPPETAAAQQKSSDGYVRNWQRFARDLKPLD